MTTATTTGRDQKRRAWLALGAAACLAAQALTFLVGPAPVEAAGVTVSNSCASTNIAQIATGGIGTAIAGPIATSFASTPYVLPVGVDATADTTVAPGGTLDYAVAITIDLQTIVTDQLNGNVIPGILAQSAGLAPSAYLEQTLTNIVIPFPVPAGTTVSGSPSASGSSASAAVAGGSVRVTIPSLSAGSYQPGAGTPATTIAPKGPAVVNLSFSAVADGALANGTIIPLNPGPATFDLRYSVGIGGLASSGGITATETCTTNGALVLASTQVAAGGSTTAPTTGPPTSPTTAPPTTPTTAPPTTPTTAPPTTPTTAPTTTTTAPPATDPGTVYVTCAASDVVEVPGGNPAVSPSVVEGVKNTPYQFPVPWASEVTPGADGAATYSATLNFDLQAVNDATLVNTVAPAASAQIPGLGDTAYLEQDYTDLTMEFALPAGATLDGTATATGTGAGSAVGIASGSGKITATIPNVEVGSYQPLSVATPQRAPLPPFSITVDFTLDGVGVSPIAIPPSASTFGHTYVTGVAIGGSGLSGGAVATQTCTISATVPPPPPAGPGTTAPPPPAEPAVDAAAAAAAAVTPSGALPYTGIDVGTLRLVIFALFLLDLGYLLMTVTTQRTPMDYLRRRR